MTFFVRRSILLLLTGAAACLIAGCGQKGRLVLPVRPPAISTPYPASLPEPAADTDPDTAPVEDGGRKSDKPMEEHAPPADGQQAPAEK